MNWKFLVALLVPFSLAGCSGGVSLETAIHQQVDALVAGDADAHARFYGDTWIDFGGCVLHEDETPADWFREWVESGEHAQEFEGWTSETLLVWSEMEIEPVSNATWGLECEHYEQRLGDMTVFVPPTEDSPWFDGFYGLYRQDGGRWIQIGGD